MATPAWNAYKVGDGTVDPEKFSLLVEAVITKGGAASLRTLKSTGSVGAEKFDALADAVFTLNSSQSTKNLKHQSNGSISPKGYNALVDAVVALP